MQTIDQTTKTAEQIVNEFQKAPAVNGSVNWKKRIRVNNIRDYWDTVIGEDLAEDETIRMTCVAPYEKNGNKIDNQRTIYDQIRNVEELIQVIEKTYNGVKKNEWKNDVGFSISSAIFKYIEKDERGEPVAPGSHSFRRVNTMVIDLDSHIDKEKKGRFNFNSYEETSRHVAASHVLNKVNDVLYNTGLDIQVHTQKVYATGGGLQFVLKFNRAVERVEAGKVYDYIKFALIKASEKFVVYGSDHVGNVSSCWFEYDKSSGDFTHTQRLAGTINPKLEYQKAFAEEIKEFYNEDKYDDAVLSFRSTLMDSTLTDSKIDSLKKALIVQSITFKNNFKITQDVPNINIDRILLDTRAIAQAKSAVSEGNKQLISNVTDSNILKQIPVQDQIAYMVKAAELELLPDASRKYKMYKCPFHEDDNGSFAIYQNAEPDANGNFPLGAVAIVKDFHEDGKTYNLISMLIDLAKEKGEASVHIERGGALVSREVILADLQAEFQIELKTADRKTIHKEEVEGEVMGIIHTINQDDFVYYRLANKQRACIIRSFKDGKSSVFDGTRMLSDHILANQLGVHAADMELRTIFHEKFVQHILIDAFEEFRPGKPYTYEIDFIKYVNLWIPGQDYLKIHELAESIEQMDLTSALKIIEERLPNIWFYLNQITQKGSIEYFVNWLICVGQFKTMPVIPVITTVQGTGKGVFVTQLLEYYLNHKYVNIVNSEKIANNFNAFMESSSLIVLDESDFSKTHDVDNLKMLSGNQWIQIEKKGVDSAKVERHFNMLMLTNGDTPLSHPSNDRRMTYFRGDISLADSIKYTEHENINDLISAMQDERQEFWAILCKTTSILEWEQMNLKDNQFNKQILMMHPFGKLVIKIIEDDWTDIRLQMNENAEDAMVIQANLEMVDNIKHSFDTTGQIDLTLINKYIKSLPFKSFKSVLQFIKTNALDYNGIEILTDSASVKICIDKEKIKNLIKMSNNLGNLFPEYNDENIENTIHNISADDREEKVQIMTNKLNEVDMGLTPHTADPLGILKPQAPGTVVQ